MIYNITTLDLSKEKADNLYKYLVYLQNDELPQKFEEIR